MAGLNFKKKHPRKLDNLEFSIAHLLVIAQ